MEKSSTIYLAADISKWGKKTGKMIKQDNCIPRPGGDAIPEAVTPEWLKRSKPQAD
jgi:hypothetical protein